MVVNVVDKVEADSTDGLFPHHRLVQDPGQVFNKNLKSSYRFKEEL